MPKDIGKTLKECRASAKMSVREISDFLTQKGYRASESTIYSWENGNSQPTPGALLTMCKAYGVSNVMDTFGYNGFKEDGSLQLNIEEVNIIEKYRILDTHGKEMVDFTLEKEYERSVAIAEADKPQPPAVEDSASYHIETLAAHASKEQTPEGIAHDIELIRKRKRELENQKKGE